MGINICKESLQVFLLINLVRKLMIHFVGVITKALSYVARFSLLFYTLNAAAVDGKLMIEYFITCTGTTTTLREHFKEEQRTL